VTGDSGTEKDLILVVDDDPVAVVGIVRILSHNGFEVSVALRGVDAIAIAKEQRPSLVILDILMPGMDGIEVGRRLREIPQLAALPILFLTGRDDIDDKIAAFQQAQADDYLVKPFDVRELALRVQALLRRSRHTATGPVEDQIVVGALTLDMHSFEIKTPSRTVRLTPIEFEVMRLLMSHPDRVFSTEQLLEEIWGYPPGTGMPDLVRVHIKNIRDKIEPDPRDPTYIRNLLRRGYLVVSEQRPEEPSPTDE
jgi:DNA-binding response OmpR family regulator